MWMFLTRKYVEKPSSYTSKEKKSKRNNSVWNY